MAAITKLPFDIDANPELRYRKWHQYDRFDDDDAPRTKAFDTKESQRPFLQSVSRAVHATARASYIDWYEGFRTAMESVRAETPLTASTLWRMVVGTGTNPALESGVVLHHLLGFPYIPGSAVKGLLHHVAEMGLLEGPGIPEFPGTIDPAPPYALIEAIDQARLVRAFFGSLFVRRHEARGLKHGPKTPAEMLETWLDALKEFAELPESWKGTFEALKTLLSPQHTGGMLTCFDAVPSLESMKEGQLLDVDILNPHYFEYYRSSTGRVPSDDENPIPKCFLAVRPGAEFEFRFRLAALPREKPRDSNEGERKTALGTRTLRDLRRLLGCWLRKGLEEWGAGAKTAAGYGYFDFHAAAEPETTALAENAPTVINPEREAEEYLEGAEDPGTLADRVDRVRERPAEVQAAVARLVVERFPYQVKNWRKKTDKPKVDARVQWLDSFLAGGTP